MKKKNNSKKMKKNKIEKCDECKTRIASFECSCGLTFCGKCSDDGQYCPADECIEHYVNKITKK